MLGDGVHHKCQKVNIGTQSGLSTQLLKHSFAIYLKCSVKHASKL